ncbi:hypothetical protein NEOLEDRAFT_1155303 [Neolentinus lepideus HHB14362 ss-1]|uniref:Ribosomal protein L19 n=1 Tax=Neolentinus lepideus HHB14362 ss-1 TaxID=1314782 RepID=A0A165TNA3_9AGAM|nr:hypothetical protein NEOLEDRAFT_1155303 [Neolentinus lepideus HHB14362 ss-1]
MSTAAASATPYPFSKIAFVRPASTIDQPILESLQKGKGLMPYLQSALVPSEKQQWIQTLFSKRHPDRLQPGSVVTVTTAHAPNTFSGVVLSIRRRGPDTSFVVRNVVQRTGVEMQFFVNSPHLTNIKVVKKPGDGGGRAGRRTRRAKLFYLRHSPEKMTAIAGGIKA